MRSTTSPYLTDSRRLAEVIAALQATGTYKYYQLPFENSGGRKGWAYRITGDPQRAAHFRELFAQHPEFFRIDSDGNGSLVWRRQNQKLYDVDRDLVITRDEFEKLTTERKARISRSPLGPSELTALIDAAVELHSRAVAQRSERRWWVTPAVSVVVAFGGVILGAVIG
jgi:hypothetical protein